MLTLSSHTHIYIHAYTLRIRLVKRAGPLTSSAYECLGWFFFYGRLFDIFINILSMCFTKSAEIRTMCPAAIAFAQVAYRRTPSSMYRVSTVSKLASFCPSVLALSIYPVVLVFSLVQLSRGAHYSLVYIFHKRNRLDIPPRTLDLPCC